MKKANFTLGTKEITRFPERPELSNNGGDYYFYKTPILKNGEKVGVIMETSAGFDYCMASGNFTDTVVLDCTELGISLEVAKGKWYSDDDYPDGEITVEEFLNW